MTRTLSVQQRLARLSPAQRALIAQRISTKQAAVSAAVAEPPRAIEVSVGERFDPFPLTDLQQAYWIGRDTAFQLGGVAAHSYFEIEGVGLNLEKLEAALGRVIERHDSLRIIVTPDGQQRVLPEVPSYRIERIDLRETPDTDAETRLSSIRDELSHQVLPADSWPLFEIRAALLPAERTRLFVSLDGLICDGWSLMLFFREWAALYEDREADLPELRSTFRDYVLAERRLVDTDSFRKARDYWLGRLDNLPSAPTLPLRHGSPDSPRFTRRQRMLSTPLWRELRMRASSAGLTPTVVLLAAYVDVLALWSQHSRFCINIPKFNRLPLHPDVPHLIGEFASFTILEVEARANAAFPLRALAIQEQLWRDLAHAEFGGVRILRELARRRGATIMPVVFTAAPEHPSHKNITLAGEARRLGDVVFAINQTPQVWLDNHIGEVDGALVCDWDSVDAMFPDGVSEDLLDAYMRHLERLATSDAAWSEDHRATVRMLIPGHQLALRQQINGVRKPIPESLVHDAFTARAQAAPEATALIAAGRTLSYGELLRLATSWAQEIHRRQDPGRAVVAIVMEKGWEQVVAALAVVQSGFAYVPIDARVPPERLHHLLERAEARIALTQSRLLTSLDWPSTVTPLPVDTMVPSEGVALPRPSPGDLCYLLYTSGSSGTPKGVMIAHRGVVNALRETEQRFAIGPTDRVLALTALHHDMSVFDIFGVLGAGGTLIMPRADLAREPAHWLDLLREHRVTLWNSVPAMMEMLVEHAGNREGELPSLRLAFLGGDWIPLTIPRRLAALAPNAQLVSVGGPTETTLWNIWYPVERFDPEWTSIPYGKPIANTQYFILNDALEDCPTWVVGEQYCGGVGVARGYWRDEHATNSKFVRHPATGYVIYRTGDLGRYLPDGTIEFVGRADLQVKINGQRIELGEIESTLSKHPSISSAIVIAAGEPRGRKRIVAYVVQGAPRATETELRAFVARQLPDHMVPSAIVTLGALPLTANGKVDRRKLAEQDLCVADSPKPGAGAPATSVLTRVCAIVTKILGLEQLDPNASLVACGANSIDMVRIGNQLDEAFGFRPRIDELFRLDCATALANFYADKVARESSQGAPPVVASADLTEIIRSYEQILDPDARDAFKNSRPGVRRSDPGIGAISLVKPDAPSWLEGFRRRRSNRSFSLRPVGFTAFSEMLACLMEVTLDGRTKRLHGSPGGLYPIQVYLHVKPGRVEGVDAGTYYYHPVHHCLVSLTPNVDLDRDIHIPFINTPTFDRAAFSMFLIADLGAIAPSYGHYSLHFSTIEAGLIAQTLELMAPASGIGLCQIGSLQFDRIRSLFLLDRPHVLIHSLVGGLIDELSSPTTVAASTSSRSAVQDTLERLRELSDDEVRRLLEADRRINDPQMPMSSALQRDDGI